jgi:exonuclease SbcD
MCIRDSLRDMRILEGDLESLLEQGRFDPNNKDYLLIRLTDQTSILDPMGKLRQVYENVLHIEKTWLQESGGLQVNSARLKRGELEMFTDFFEQVSGIPLSEDQHEAIKTIITNISTHEGGLL